MGKRQRELPGCSKGIAAGRTASRTEEAGGAKRRATPSLLKAGRSTSDELTVLYSEGGTLHCTAHGGGRPVSRRGLLEVSSRRYRLLRGA
jgi:hypothetical protein